MSLPLSSHSHTASPVGPIPMDFQRMGDFCRAAHIRYNDQEITYKNGTMIKYRTWRVVSDDTEVGKRTTFTKFKKMCLLLDWLTWKYPDCLRNEILELAIVPSARQETWQDMNDRMAKEGVPGYDILMRKKKDKKSQESIDAFDE